MNETSRRAYSDVEERNFNLKHFFLKYLEYWYLYLLFLALFLAGAHFYNWYATPIYESSCRIIIKAEGYNSTDNLLSDLHDYSRIQNLENEIQILKSVSLITKAVKHIDLSETYVLQGKIKSTELYKASPFVILPDTLNDLAYFSGMRVKIINHEKFELSYLNKVNSKEFSQIYRFGSLIVNGLGTFKVSKRKSFDDALYDDPSYDKRDFKVFFNPIENTATYFASALKVEVASAGSSILLLSITDVVPEQCSDFLNKLTEEYINNNIEQKNLLASNSLKFIDSQIKQISMELKEIERTMLDFKTKKGIVDIDEESKLFLRQVKDYDEKVAQYNTQLSFVNYLENYIVENKKINDIAPTSIGINDPLLVKLISGLSELENEREKRNFENNPKSPTMKILDDQIKKAKVGIIENLKTIKQGYMISTKEANNQLGIIEGKIRDMPKNEIELINIKRQFTVKEGLYVFLLQKRSETAILLASSVSDNWVVDKALPNYNPVKPVKSKSYAIALILGLILPTLIISIKEILNDKISDKNELDSNTKIPLLGIIGINENGFGLFSEKKSKNFILEAFRTIRTNIKYFLNETDDGKKQNTILITSSISTEGKTFCSYNLAGIFAMSEKRTILVCLDLRKPKVMEGLTLKQDKGISNYLAGSANLEEVIQPSGSLPYLDIILSGPVPPNPAELLLKVRMDEMFGFLKEKYDYVIIDTSPIGMVTDGIVLTKYSDMNIYVVRQNVTRKQHLKFINKLYEEGKIKNLGIIFNAVKVSKGSEGYGYGYGYGYGEEHEVKKKSKLSRLLTKKSSV